MKVIWVRSRVNINSCGSDPMSTPLKTGDRINLDPILCKWGLIVLHKASLLASKDTTKMQTRLTLLELFVVLMNQNTLLQFL